MKLHQIVLPTPFYVGPVNVYVIRQDPITLIDIGPNTEEAFNALVNGLAKLGLSPESIRRIIISHGHSDHCGLASRIQLLSGCKVYVHSWEADFVSRRLDYDEHSNLLKRAGVPQAVIDAFEQGYMKISPYAGNQFKFEIIGDGDEIEFEKESLRVIHTPGHTPGSICLLRESNRELLAADTVIKHITPNPMLNCDPIDRRRRFPSLSQYICSVRRIKELAPTYIHSGHGQPITDYGEHFNNLLKHTHQRQEKLLKLIPAKGITAWEASLLLFPDARNEQRYLAVSETQAHLDMAVAEGKLSTDKRDDGSDVYKF
ncbi:MAG: MBL fold metallo-hydrolase [Acidobacteriota bacterium]|nr:MBL fold metallo-hydrolase [Blastocatellia bacterium]MDW8412049.1 MBL fold metallo-hydrolase [Acidobacteriota bacterium]